jgi:hypothetical protein
LKNLIVIKKKLQTKPKIAKDGHKMKYPTKGGGMEGRWGGSAHSLI